MRSGRHFVQFTAVSGETAAMFGAIRPGLDLGNLPFAGTKQEQELQLRQVRLSCFFEEREKTRCDACNQRLRAPVRCNLLQCWGCKADVWAATKNPPDAEAAAAAIRPAARDPHAQDGHCMYISLTGKHQDHGSTWRAWDGMQGATDGDRIGMLLDLDQGSMTLYKNGDLLGRMVAGGLSGEYCWAATMLFGWDTVRIGAAATPPPPTEADLAAAKVRAAEAASGDGDDSDDEDGAGDDDAGGNVVGPA